MTEPTPSPEIDELLAYRGWVRRLCRQLVRSEVEAEDVEQETWRRALESPPRHRGNLKAWLATVARSAAMQRGRQAGASRAGEESLRQNMQADADAEHAGADRRDGPDAIAEQRETFALLHRLLIDLEEPYGEVVFLRYVQGLPPRRIARRLELPVATVKTRLHRGLEILRRRTRKQLGADWRARCMVFVPSLPGVAATTLTTTIAMSNPSKLILAAAILILAIPVYSVLENDRGIDEVKESTEAGVSAAKPLMDPVADALVADLPPESDAPRVEQALPEPSGPPLKIVVKDRLTRKPVVGAEVFVLDLGHPQLGLEALHEQGRKSFASESLLREFGTRSEANELGEAEVPGVYDGSQVQVCASTESSYDHMFLKDLSGQNTVQVELLLRERIDRTVEVVDANGAPVAGLQVSWILAGQEGWSKSSVMLASTDARGRAKFRNMQVRASDFEGDSTRHAMSARFGSLSPIRQEFDPFEASAQLIRLQLPRGVALRVRVDRDLLEKCVDGLPIFLCAVANNETRQNFFDSGRGWSGLASADFLDGEAVFPLVEPGFQGYLQLQTGGPRENILQRVEIAADPQGEQIATVHLPKQDDGIEFQVVDGKGEPLDAIRWDIEVLELRDAPEIRHTLRTRIGGERAPKLREAQGYLRDSPESRKYLVRVVSNGDPSDIQSARLEFDAALLLPQERCVRVEVKDNLIVSGRVLNQVSNPIAGAQVYLHSGNLIHPKSGDIPGQRIVATTDEQGEFRVRGDQIGTTRLTVAVPGSVQLSYEFIQGVPDQEFMIVVSPNLKGAILTDSDVPPGALHARLDPLHKVEQVGMVRIDGATGALESSHSSPGRFQLVIEDSFLQEVFRSDPIDLQEGVVQPEFLNPLDLRGKLHVHQLQVVGSEGDHATRFSVREVDRNWLKEHRRSPLTLVTAVDRLRVVIDADGYALSLPTELIGEQTIRLSRGVSGRIDIPDKLILANSLYDWVLRFEAVDSNAYGWKPVRIVFLDQDQQAFELPDGGEWRVRLNFQGKKWRSALAGSEDEFSWSFPVEEFHPDGFEFSVPADTEEWVLSLPLSQEVLDKVVAGN